MASGVNLYAEFLLNIRQVTIFATLSNISGGGEAHISSDRKSLSLSHDGNSASIAFPSGIVGKATVHLPVQKARHVSCRLELTEDDKPPHDIEVANDCPWPASALTSETQAACRSCESVVVLAQTDRVWKDLPRDDWAETMDMWHCHKPDVPICSKTETVSKAYGSANRPSVRVGLGFVDTCHLVLPAAECNRIKVSVGAHYSFFFFITKTMPASALGY